MDERLQTLIRLLDLEPLEVNLFRGQSRDIGAPRVFGGQVLGQALTAAATTVDGRVVHSLHSYFLRRGDFTAPIVYQVDRSLDGHSFSNRRVVAIQHGEQIFNMTASFQVAEDGFDHQAAMPQVPPPESLPDPAPAPELFDLDGEGYSFVRSGCERIATTDARYEQARLAAENCPEEAIRLEA